MDAETGEGWSASRGLVGKGARPGCPPGTAAAASPSRRPILRAALTAVTLEAACYGAADPPRPAGDEMHAYVQATGEARRAAVFGDSVVLRWAVRSLHTRGSVEGIPAEARPWLADLRRTARAVETESDLTEAVRGTALLARHCGGCHREVGAVAAGWPPEAPRPDLDGPDAHARGADWALGRLWDGVAHPSEAAWKAGREVLGDPRTFGGAAVERPVEREAARAALRRLEGMAWVAARSGGLEERARVLGDVMVTCADCHTTVRGGGL